MLFQDRLISHLLLILLSEKMAINAAHVRLMFLFNWKENQECVRPHRGSTNLRKSMSLLLDEFIG
jgi:hypothetical protein